ncbi:hypothetical protein E2C01_047890 [Portunus trituberculatus]|uniref:Uncharacterized protein n=1 Tax=Portunus trituberculatus TaxID=210409 RepID=A0A5B7G934_PORTR|nr:hypothetical protein [Portunus trituberculatus]
MVSTSSLLKIYKDSIYSPGDGDLLGLVDGLVDDLLSLLSLRHLLGDDAVLARHLHHRGTCHLLSTVDGSWGDVLGLDHRLHLGEGLHLCPVDGGVDGGGHHLGPHHLLGNDLRKRVDELQEEKEHDLDDENEEELEEKKEVIVRTVETEEYH